MSRSRQSAVIATWDQASLAYPVRHSALVANNDHVMIRKLPGFCRALLRDLPRPQISGRCLGKIIFQTALDTGKLQDGGEIWERLPPRTRSPPVSLYGAPRIDDVAIRFGRVKIRYLFCEVRPVQVITSPFKSPVSSNSRTITWTPPTRSMSTME